MEDLPEFQDCKSCNISWAHRRELCVISEMSRWSERSDAPPEFSGDPMHPTGVASAVYFSYRVQKHLVYAKACRSASVAPTVHRRSHCRHYEFYTRAHFEALVRAKREYLQSSKLCEAEWQYLCVSGYVNISPRDPCTSDQRILVRLVMQIAFFTFSIHRTAQVRRFHKCRTVCFSWVAHSKNNFASRESPHEVFQASAEE